MSLAGAGVLGATYAGGSMMAANAGGMEASVLRETLTPSVLEAASFGFLAARHATGLQSGGLMGYSTFFSGYDPEMHGAARRYSLGRVGGAAVSAAGEALGKIPALAGSRYIESMKSFHRFGMWSFAYEDEHGYDTDSGHPVHKSNKSKMGRRYLKKDGGWDLSPMATDANKRSGHIDKKAWALARAQKDNAPTFSKWEKMQDARPSKPTAGGAPNKSGRVVSYFASWFGGTGGSKDGSEFELRSASLGDGTKIAAPRASAKSAVNIVKGSLGRMAGRGFQAAAAYEVASYAAKGIGYAVGAGYESMVKSTERIKRKTGSDEMMSGGYFNRAATSERQRAVQTMNTTTLHPRYQMMGNEAYWMHN